MQTARKSTTQFPTPAPPPAPRPVKRSARSCASSAARASASWTNGKRVRCCWPSPTVADRCNYGPRPRDGRRSICGKNHGSPVVAAGEWTIEQRALAQGHIAVNSVLRDWIKGQVTAVECGILSFEAVFAVHMIGADGRPLLEKAVEMLPRLEQKVVELKSVS